jgi:hypothetical protein
MYMYRSGNAIPGFYTDASVRTKVIRRRSLSARVRDHDSSQLFFVDVEGLRRLDEPEGAIGISGCSGNLWP